MIDLSPTQAADRITAVHDAYPYLRSSDGH